MKRLLLIISLFSFALLQSCKKETPIPPKIAPTLTISEILDSDVTYTSFVVNGSVVSNDKNTVTERGVCYSKTPNPKITDGKVVSTTDNFKLEITNLDINAKYYIRTYTTTGGETFYGEKEITKTTRSLAGTTWEFIFTLYPNNSNPPRVATSYVTIYANGTTKYDEPSNPGLYLSYGTYVITGNTIECKLSPNQTLVGKASGMNLSGTMTGASPTRQDTWSASSKNLPDLTINEILDADVTYTSFAVNGLASSEKDVITERGVCYSKLAHPKITDGKIVAAANNFKLEIPNLDVNTTYYIKTYVIVGGETFYSDKQITKTTLSLAGTTWDIAFTFYNTSSTVNWNADVTFNANGTTKYDEPAYPGVYLMNGTYVITGNTIDYKMGPPSDPGYTLVGKVNGKTMSGTYNGSPIKPNVWTATQRK